MKQADRRRPTTNNDSSATQPESSETSEKPDPIKIVDGAFDSFESGKMDIKTLRMITLCTLQEVLIPAKFADRLVHRQQMTIEYLSSALDLKREESSKLFGQLIGKISEVAELKISQIDEL